MMKTINSKTNDRVFYTIEFDGQKWFSHSEGICGSGMTIAAAQTEAELIEKIEAHDVAVAALVEEAGMFSAKNMPQMTEGEQYDLCKAAGSI